MMESNQTKVEYVIWGINYKTPNTISVIKFCVFIAIYCFIFYIAIMLFETIAYIVHLIKLINQRVTNNFLGAGW